MRYTKWLAGALATGAVLGAASMRDVDTSPVDAPPTRPSVVAQRSVATHRSVMTHRPVATQRPVVTQRSVTTASLGVHFEANVGQDDVRVAFTLRGADHVTFLTADAFTTSMVVGESPDGTPQLAAHRVRLVGSNSAAVPVGERPLIGRVNHLKGNDPSEWITDVPTYEAVRVSGVYPRIDLVHHGDRRLHEYDFVVAPGGDPDAILMSFEGVDELRLNADGDLVITDAGREVLHTRPVVYQDTPDGRTPLTASFRLDGDRHVGFRFDEHDPGLPLVIDPGIAYSTLLGSSFGTYLDAIAVDDAGHAHIGGESSTADFPTESALDGTLDGVTDGVIAKLGVTGSRLLYSTYIGGGGKDTVVDVAVANDGGLLAVGLTESGDFPTKSAVQGTNAGSADAFLLHLNAAGSALERSTYFGGSGGEHGLSVAQDATGRIYLAGRTTSTDLPTTVGAVHPSALGGWDAFVVRWTASGANYDYVTYVGGSANDAESGTISMFVDEEGRAHLGATTTSTDLPTVIGTLHSSHRGGGSDAYVGRLAADGSAWEWITYFGGSGSEQACMIAPAPSDNIWVAGTTLSTNILTYLPFQPGNAGAFDGYIAHLSSLGNSILSSTYIGGSNADAISGLAPDPTGGAWISGVTASSNFPTMDALRATRSGEYDMFVSKVDQSGQALLFSTYFGSSDQEQATRRRGLDVDTHGGVYFIGNTRGNDFPTAGPPFQAQLGMSGSPFVTKLGDPPPIPVIEDTELYAIASTFKIDRKKHARDTAADMFTLKGLLNPRGMVSDLSGATITLSVGRQAVVAAQLDARGRARSARGAQPSFRISVKARTGAYQLKVGGLDLRSLLDIADATGVGISRTDVGISISGAGLGTSAVEGVLGYAVNSRAGKSNRGTFAFKKHATEGGAFQATKATAREQPGGGHKVLITAPLVGLDSAPLTFPGDVRITLDGSVALTIPNASLRTAGTPGPRSTTSYSRGLGEVEGLVRFSYSGRRRTITLATDELVGLPIPAAGNDALTGHGFSVVIEIDTIDGPVQFSTIIELARRTPTSTAWSR